MSVMIQPIPLRVVAPNKTRVRTGVGEEKLESGKRDY